MPPNATIRFTKRTFALQAFCALHCTVQRNSFNGSNTHHDEYNLCLLPVLDSALPLSVCVTSKVDLAEISSPRSILTFTVQQKTTRTCAPVYRFLLSNSTFSSYIDLQNAPLSGKLDFVLPENSITKRPCFVFAGDTRSLRYDYWRANCDRQTTYNIPTDPIKPETSRKLSILPHVSRFNPKYPRSLYFAGEHLTPMTELSKDLGLSSVNSLQKTLSAMDITSSAISTPFDFDDDSCIEAALKANSVCVPLDTDHKAFAVSGITPTCDPSYPDHLNPFHDDDLSDRSSGTTSSDEHSCSTTEGSDIDSVPSFSIFNDQMYSTGRASAPETHIMVSRRPVVCSGASGQTPLAHRARKPAAPSPPNELQSLPSVPLQKATARVLPTTEQRSVCAQIDSTSSTVQQPSDTVSLSMRNQGVSKRPAPDLPIPAKRLVRADPNASFVEYRELHQRLYEVNSRLTDVEREAKRLQSGIHQASNGHGDVKIVLKNLSMATKLRETLLREQTDILRRLHCQELEERHGDLEHELRILLSKPDSHKSDAEKAREAQLLSELKSVVDERADLADQIDRDMNTARSLEQTSRSAELPTSPGHSKAHKRKKKGLLTIFKRKRKASNKH